MSVDVIEGRKKEALSELTLPAAVFMADRGVSDERSLQVPGASSGGEIVELISECSQRHPVEARHLLYRALHRTGS